MNNLNRFKKELENNPFNKMTNDWYTVDASIKRTSKKSPRKSKSDKKL